MKSLPFAHDFIVTRLSEKGHGMFLYRECSRYHHSVFFATEDWLDHHVWITSYRRYN